MADGRDAVGFSLSRVQRLVLGAVLAGGVLLFGAQLVVMSVQLDRVSEQNSRMGRLLEESLPVLDDARPLVADVAESRRPLTRSIENLPSLIRHGTRLAKALTDAEVAMTVEATRELVLALGGGRLPRLVELSTGALEDVRAHDLVARSATAAALAPETLAATRELLTIQRNSQAILERSEEIQRETLRHARSLDRKTGGPVAAP